MNIAAPTPWYESTSPSSRELIYDASGRSVASSGWSTIRARILRAVNAHDALVGFATMAEGEFRSEYLDNLMVRHQPQPWECPDCGAEFELDDEDHGHARNCETGRVFYGPWDAARKVLLLVRGGGDAS